MRWLYILPVTLFLALLGIFTWNLIHARDDAPSPLLDGAAPNVVLPALDTKAKAFEPQDLADGHVTILNVWASWCVPCRVEAPALQQIAALKDVKLYGLVYKDRPALARAFLNDNGNPYERIDLDAAGLAGIEWGITGVPETFVIDGRGIIRLRYAGPLVGNAVSDVILPAVERAQREG